MTLAQLAVGEAALITCITSQDPALRERMTALGLRAGREVAVLRRGAFRGPLHVRVGRTELMMRLADAGLVQLTPPCEKL